MIRRLLTKNFSEIPLVFIDFNYKYYKKYGKEKSCVIHSHPLIQDDEVLKDKLKDVIDYIRDNYDLDKIP